MLHELLVALSGFPGGIFVLTPEEDFRVSSFIFIRVDRLLSDLSKNFRSQNFECIGLLWEKGVAKTIVYASVDNISFMILSRILYKFMKCVGASFFDPWEKLFFPPQSADQLNQPYANDCSILGQKLAPKSQYYYHFLILLFMISDKWCRPEIIWVS